MTESESQRTRSSWPREEDKELLFGRYVDRLIAGENIDFEAIKGKHGDIGAAVAKQLADFQSLYSNFGNGDAVHDAQPEFVGRYRIDGLVGEGGFGRVYLAFDEQLQRSVAIKVPHRHLVASPQDADAYLAEARTLAELDHPNIITVFDAGNTDEIPCYIVSKYVEGISLSQRMKADMPTWLASAEYIAVVADALHYAHKKGFVHRDVKPGNILVDEADTPHLVDFGIALRDKDYEGHRFVGTPAYMSPEQARGEGHRVDGRSDIFSLGTVLYELLTGRTPFRGGETNELLAKIATAEPRPPRQINERIPIELERVCLRALAKRASDRYTTAHDFANDLRALLPELRQYGAGQAVRSESGACPPSTSRRHVPTDDHGSGAPTGTSECTPKGLRSFDQRDADFFVDLLPGPRGRDGLPESIRFWLQATGHERGSSGAFPIGLIYGPSGCGKSSLVQAGILPRMPPDTVALYLEATASETVEDIRGQLQRRFPQLPAELDLKGAFAALRRGQFVDENAKVLLVLDQFEQWLHANQNYEDAPLVSALRQCDGIQVQCILVLRDDFWMAITRFMRAVDVRLVEGWNSGAVDLFPIPHARDVLAKFGVANGDLPSGDAGRSKEQEQFLSQAVDGLSEDGTVVCVRLALFADMMKGRPWTTDTLRTVGGTKGVGVEFLESTFTSSAAPPQHRYHESAARAVLGTLLPESGLDIKGHKRSNLELLKSSGYRNPRDFAELIVILDHDLRLISPAATGEEQEPHDAGTGAPDSEGPSFYQLTHDYLVPSLREWLTRKQRETRRGRAELRLVELSDAWNARQEKRYLPTWLEYLSIRSFTKRGNWTESQRKLIRQADKYFGVWGAAILFTVLSLALSGSAIRRSVIRNQQASRLALDIQNSKTLVKALLAAPADAVPYAIANVEPLREYAIPELHREFDNADGSSERRFVAALALAHFDEVKSEFLVDKLRDANGEHCGNIIAMLQRDREKSARVMLEAFRNARDLEYRTRLAIVLLHLGESGAAEQMLASADGDPTDRTRFIATFPKWISGWIDVDLLGNKDVSPSFLYGMFCSIAEVPPNVWDVDVKQRLVQLLHRVVARNRHAGVHSAAGLVLRRWGISESPVAGAKPPDRIDDERQELALSSSIGRLRKKIRRLTEKNVRGDELMTSAGELEAMRQRLRDNERELELLQNTWYVNSLGMTMIRARIGPDILSVSDREIAIRYFEEFARDAGLADWEGPDAVISPSKEHPVQKVRSDHAYRFCNWLSERESLPLYYLGPATQSGAWLENGASDGYRLLDIDSWDALSNASATTRYFVGSRESELMPYAVFGVGGAERCGSKLPNPLGLFDMFGNVGEYCSNLYTANPESVRPNRVLRGGNFTDNPTHTYSWNNAMAEGKISNDVGFRVARKQTVRAGDDRGRVRSARQVIVDIEDQQPIVSWRRLGPRMKRLAAARQAVEPNLVSYTSIDEKLEKPLGSVEWDDSDANSPATRIQEFLQFARNSTEPDVAMRRKYVEGCLLQISGNVAAAATVFELLSKQDPDRPEPLGRAISCLRLTGSAGAFGRATEAIRRFPNAPGLWDLWINIGMNDRGLDASQLMEIHENAPQSHKELDAYSRVTWLLNCLLDDCPLRINCGALQSLVADGVDWYRDVFFVDGHVDTLPPQHIMSDGDATVYVTSHSFATDRGGTYRVPLPNGRYRVTLSFCEGWAVNGDRSFDVAIEKQPILEQFVPRSRGFAVGFDVQHECIVEDGLLEIDFVPRKNNADVNGIQIERLEEHAADSCGTQARHACD